MKTIRVVSLALGLCMLGGCCDQPVKTKSARLSKVVSDLRTELAEIRAECEKDAAKCTNYQYLSETTVQLAVVAADESKAGLEVALPIGGISGARTHSEGSTSTITLKFSNPVFASVTTPVGHICDDGKGGVNLQCVTGVLDKTPLTNPAK